MKYTSRRGTNFGKQQTAKENSSNRNPSSGVTSAPTTENTAKAAPVVVPASLMGCIQPLSCIAPTVIYTPESATANEEYAEEDYW